MAIQGITFDNQLVSARDDGTIFAGILEDGIVKGCALNYTGNTLTIGAGYFVIAGRLLRLTSNEPVTTQASGAVARITLELDMTGEATEDNFTQARIFAQYAANVSSLPDLVQDDINGIGTIYQIEICILELNQGNIESILSQKTAGPAVGVTADEALAKADAALPKAGGTVTGPLTQQGMLKLGPTNYGDTLPAAGNAGRIFFKKV